MMTSAQQQDKKRQIITSHRYRLRAQSSIVLHDDKTSAFDRIVNVTHHLPFSGVDRNQFLHSFCPRSTSKPRPALALRRIVMIVAAFM